jgi:hypothetical protein
VWGTHIFAYEMVRCFSHGHQHALDILFTEIQSVKFATQDLCAQSLTYDGLLIDCAVLDGCTSWLNRTIV